MKLEQQIIRLFERGGAEVKVDRTLDGPPHPMVTVSTFVCGPVEFHDIQAIVSNGGAQYVMDGGSLPILGFDDFKAAFEIFLRSSPGNGRAEPTSGEET